jgi:hypothetical protein
MKLPTRIAVTLTTAITGLMALSAEVKMSHPAHVVCLIAGGAILGLFVHPTEGGTLPAGEIPPPVPSSVTESQL